MIYELTIPRFSKTISKRPLIYDDRKNRKKKEEEATSTVDPFSSCGDITAVLSLVDALDDDPSENALVERYRIGLIAVAVQSINRHLIHFSSGIQAKTHSRSGFSVREINRMK